MPPGRIPVVIPEAKVCSGDRCVSVVLPVGIDTGASTSFMDFRTLCRILEAVGPVKVSASREVRTPSGSTRAAAPEGLSISFGGMEIRDPVIMPEPATAPLMVGQDFLEKNGCIIDAAKRQIRCGKFEARFDGGGE